MIKLPKSKPKLYIAINDIGTSGYKDPFDSSVKITYDTNSVYFGWYCVSGDPRESKGFIMRFDLRDIPSSWTKCEISLYVYQRGQNSGSALVYLFAGDWTEEEWSEYYHRMGDFEIYWKIEESIGFIQNTIGFQKIDITEYIGNITTSTFSIAVMPKTEYCSGSGYIYSSEWDGSDFPYVLPEEDSYKAYLPQLIWS